MKRRLTKLVVFLVLGTVVNVAVAWGCAAIYWDWNGGETVPYTPEIAREICMGINPVASETPVSAFEGYDQITFGHRFSITVANSGQSNQVYAHVVWAGWPSVSMDGAFWIAPNVDGKRSLWVLPWEPNHNQLLIPFRPIWPGFAINTIFYAAIVWLLTLAPSTVRRLIRVKRGHCIKCGYDLRGTSGGGGSSGGGCPECGWGREGSDEPGI